MKLKKFIQEIRKITIKQAADELGYTRPHLTAVCNGLPAGKRLATKIEKWSNGLVTAFETMFPGG